MYRGDDSVETHHVFGVEGAAGYDDDARLMARRYRRAHQIQNALVCRVLKSTCAARPAVVDLGCGTGNDALEILSRVPGAVYIGIERSVAMLDRARVKLRPFLGMRAVLLNDDFRELTPLTLTELCEKDLDIVCVMSALALHHYQMAEKRLAYERARAVLQPGGLLVVTDLFANVSNFANDYAMRCELVDVRRARSRRWGATPPMSMSTTLSERHYREENRPQVLLEELAVICSVGFSFQEIIYRHGQLAVISAGG